jgi:ribosomal protein L12E/L44/L45/RPP1/RPP2
LLEAIGVISKSARKKAAGKSASYQDAVTAPLAREDDEDANEEEEEEEDDEHDLDFRLEQGTGKLRSVHKVYLFFS